MSFARGYNEEYESLKTNVKIQLTVMHNSWEGNCWPGGK